MAHRLGHSYACSFHSFATSSSLSTPLNIGPSAGKGAQLQLTLPSLKASELASLNLVFEILGSFEQRSLESAVSPF